MKDYARAKRNQPKETSPEVQRPFFSFKERIQRIQWSRTWTYAASAVVLVIILSAVGYWKISHRTLTGAVADKSVDTKKSKSKSKPSAQENSKEPEVLAKPQFEFYDILPERDAMVPRPIKQSPPPPPPSAIAPQSTPQSSGSVSAQPIQSPPIAAKKQYVIQVASYQDKAQAQKVIGRLRQAQIQARLVLTQSGWWRIDVGPIDNRREAESIRRNIQAQGVVGSLIREILKN